MIQSQSQERQINGVTYRCSPFAARPGGNLFARVLKVLGPSVGSLSLLDDDDSNLGKVIGLAISQLAANLHRTETMELIVDLLHETVRIEPDTKTKQKLSEAAVFDLVFMANYTEMLQAVAFVIEVNRFFGSIDIGMLIERGRNLASQAHSQESRKESTKTS